MMHTCYFTQFLNQKYFELYCPIKEYNNVCIFYK